MPLNVYIDTIDNKRITFSNVFRVVNLCSLFKEVSYSLTYFKKIPVPSNFQRNMKLVVMSDMILINLHERFKS